mmetsp:Transcript_128138/g.255875  ORF Transcript_128138/g.255875 Transcript_128138/m.255875 type:complete len:221 (-) Transcript_128138:33-695(-)
MTSSSETLCSVAEAAEVCARELQAAASAAIFEAARARAIADLAQEYDDCHRQVASLCATLCVEIASARAALNVDRLQHDAVVALEMEVASLRHDLADGRACLASKAMQWEHPQSIIDHRRTDLNGMDSAASLEDRAQGWRCVLRFADEADLSKTAVACTGLRIEAENDGLWELLCRKQLVHDALQHCSNFRIVLLSRSCSRRWDELQKMLERIKKQCLEH